MAEVKFQNEFSKIRTSLQDARSQLDELADNVHLIGRHRRKQVEKIEYVEQALSDLIDDLDGIQGDLKK